MKESNCARAIDHVHLQTLQRSLSCMGLTMLLLGQMLAQSSDEGDLVRMQYRHPGLTVDLGVGLWANPLPLDYDGDGDLDLLVSCTDVPFNGTFLFENATDGNDASVIFRPPVKIGPGQKDLQVCYVDGKARVLGSGVEYENFTVQGFNQPRVLTDNQRVIDLHPRKRFNLWKYVDYDADGDQDLMVGIDDWSDYGWDNAFDKMGKWTNGPLHGMIYVLSNQNGTYQLGAPLRAAGEPIDVYGNPSPSMEDFDGDGDLDIITGEFVDRFTWFENVGTRSLPSFAAGKYLKNQEGTLRVDLQMMMPTAVDWNADGHMDLIVGDEDGRVALVRHTGEVRAQMPLFDSPKYLQQEADLVKFGSLVTPFSVDWDDDGDEDLICGNAAGYVGFIENMDGANPPKWNKPVHLKTIYEKPIRIMAGEQGSIQGPCERKWGYTAPVVADWDGDGLKDLIVNTIWGKVQWYKNVGFKQAPLLEWMGNVKVDWPGAETPKPAWTWWVPQADELATQWRTTPCVLDWDQDGLMDLVMLDHEGYLTFYQRFTKGEERFLRPGRRIFYGETHAGYDRKNNVVDSVPGLLQLNDGQAGRSGRRKLCFVDWDNDGDQDLLVNSLNVSLFENVRLEGDNVYFADRGVLFKTKLAGHTTSPTTVDWDGDGQRSVLIGAEDGHFYYLPPE